MGKTTELRRKAKTRFFPHAAARGFSLDLRLQRVSVIFRRRADDRPAPENLAARSHPSSYRRVAQWLTVQIEHSIEAEVSRAFAWNWRTDIKTWDDPPAQFQLDGPFASGSWGTTLMPGGESLRWQIRDVRPGASFIIELPLDGAVMSFEWLFDAVSDHRTRLTQRIVLWGTNAQA